MAEGEAEPEKKLVVDEDWKAQIEKEKAAVRAQRAKGNAAPASGSPAGQQPVAPEKDAATAADPTAAAGSEAAAAQPRAAADVGKQQDRQTRQAAGAVPPASFSVLVSMLFTQAMAALGQIPDPVSGKPDVDRALAKHYIDTLGMLEEKTKGNLSSDESTMLSEALHVLRMTFVSSAG